MLNTMKKNGVPLVYATFVCGIILTLYIQNILIWSVVVLVFQAALFCFFYFIEENGSRRGTLYYCLGIATVFITVWVCCMAAGKTVSEFKDIIFGGVYTTNIFLQAGISVIICFVIGSLVYYCSNVMQNSLLNFLIVIMPMLLFLKVGRIFSHVYIITLCFMYFMTILHCRQLREENNYTYIITKEYKWYAFLLLGILIVPASLMPKGNLAPFGEEFRTLVMFQMDVNSNANLGHLNKQSANSSGKEDMDDQILLYVYSDEPLYLERQFYTFYNWDNHSWEMKESDGFEAMDIQQNPFNMEELYAKIDEILLNKKELKQSFKGVQPELSKAINSVEKTVYVEPEMNLTMLPHPPYSYEGKFAQDLQQPVLWDVNKMMAVNGSVSYPYTVKYMKNELTDPGKILKFLSELDGDAYDRLIKVFDDEYVDYYEAFSFAYSDHIKRQFDFYPDYIKEKALEITSDSKTDYDKAKALEKYFHEGDYIYDASYVPPDLGPEYFMENSKRGACAQYATSMALMAQTLGLNVRYMEGFKASEYDEEKGAYVVRAKNSHAFVEIFIRGLGWTVFEPTVSLSQEYEDKTGDSAAKWWETISFQNILVVIACCSIVLSLIMIIRKLGNEFWFRCRILICTNEQAVKKVYHRLWKIILKEMNKKTILASNDLIHIVERGYGYDCIVIGQMFDESVYGKRLVSGKDKREVVQCYKHLYRLMKKKKISDTHILSPVFDHQVERELFRDTESIS